MNLHNDTYALVCESMYYLTVCEVMYMQAYN